MAYRFDFGWDTPYGCIVSLLERHARRDGLVLDLGCGSGAVAEPLAALGLTYVGCDIDPGGLDALRERGFETHRVDLTELDTLSEQLVKIADERPVSAVLMLDALEHLPDPDAFLEALKVCAVAFDRPLLGISLPNVGHYDVGAKLLAGRWDVTTSGLLDHTHLQLFTERRLIEMLDRWGWVEVARRDFRLHHSDQHFPEDHPVLADGTPLRELLWRLRSRMDGDQTVNQFVRLFALVSVDEPRPPAPVPPAPFLSVLVRTVGNRMANLIEALTCLAAQSDDDFEVLLLVHSARREVVEEVQRLVGLFASPFQGRVRVIQVSDGGRSRPLNVGLDAARGRYVAFLDDDDLVSGDWVEAFRAGAAAAPGRIVRGVTADRWVRRNDDERVLPPYLTLSRLEMAHSRSFDLLEHLSRNRTPFCSFAVPMQAVHALGVRFDEEVAVLEDWYFLLQLVLPCGVHDTGRVTSVYHRWQGDESTLARVDMAVWDTTRAAVLQRLDAGSLLLPAGSASRLAMMWERVLVTDAEGPSLIEERDLLRAQIEELKADLAIAQQSFDQEAKAAAELRTCLDDVLSSSSWRATYPVRKALIKARQVQDVATRRWSQRRRPGDGPDADPASD